MLRNLSEKLAAKFPRLRLAFSDIFQLKGSPVKGKSLQQKSLLNMKKGTCKRITNVAHARTQKA